MPESMVQVCPSKVTRSTASLDAWATNQQLIDQPRAAECAPLRVAVPRFGDGGGNQLRARRAGAQIVTCQRAGLLTGKRGCRGSGPRFPLS